MFDEFEKIVEQIGVYLQSQPGLEQIGWVLIAALGVWKIGQAVSSGKMDWGEAGKKLQEMFKNFQWRLEGGGNAIKSVNENGDVVYSYDTGEFFIQSGTVTRRITQLLSRSEKKQLGKMRSQVVKSLQTKHAENSAAALAAEVEKFLHAEPVKMIPVAKVIQMPRIEQEKSENFQPVRKEVVINKPLITPQKVEVAPAPKIVEKMVEVAKPMPKKIVVCCPNCRKERAVVEEGLKYPTCMTCVVPGTTTKVHMSETTADPKEFTQGRYGYTISLGCVFQNFGYDKQNKFEAYPKTYTVYDLNGERPDLKKQPSESFKNQSLVVLYKEINKKEKLKNKPAIDAKELFAEKKTDPATPAANNFAGFCAAEVKFEAPKPVVAPAPKPVEIPKPEVKSEYTLYCCPTCRTTRAIVKNGTFQNAQLCCKNEDCKGVTLAATATTGNPEEFVLENGQKVTDYLKATGKTSIRFKNYGSEDGKKFVAVLLPMTKAPLHNGVKMVAKKQPSDTIVGYVKKEKKEEKLVKTDSKIKVSYKYSDTQNPVDAVWDFSGKENAVSWSNVRETMKGMKVGEKRLIAACNNGPTGANNTQFTVTVLEIIG